MRSGKGSLTLALSRLQERVQPARLLAATLASLLVLAGCSDGAEPTQPPATATSTTSATATPATPTPETTPFAVTGLRMTGKSDLWMDIAGLVPAEDVRGIAVTDIARIREHFGIALPTGRESIEDLQRAYPEATAFIGVPTLERVDPKLREIVVYYAAFGYAWILQQPDPGAGPALGPPPWISGFGICASQLGGEGVPEGEICGPTRTYLGFDQRDIDQMILVNPAPPRQHGIVLGRIDPAVTTMALKACGSCPEAREAEFGGKTYRRWGDDLEGGAAELRNKPPIFDRFARGGNLLVEPGLAVHTLEASWMDAFIAAQSGTVPKLDEDAGYRAVIEAMGRLNTLSFAAGSQFGIEEILERTSGEGLREHLREGGLLQPFSVLATGHGIDAEGPYMALAIAHGSEAVAQANEPLLLRRLAGAEYHDNTLWATLIDEVELVREGILLVAKLRGPVAASWALWWVGGGHIVVHE